MDEHIEDAGAEEVDLSKEGAELCHHRNKDKIRGL